MKIRPHTGNCCSSLKADAPDLNRRMSVSQHDSLRLWCGMRLSHKRWRLGPYSMASAARCAQSVPLVELVRSSGAPHSVAESLSAIPLTRRSPAHLLALTDLRSPAYCHCTQISAEKSGLPLLPLPASRSSCNLAMPLPFYPLHATLCGIAVFQYYPAYLRLVALRQTVTMLSSCGKANLYNTLSSPRLSPMSITQQTSPSNPTSVWALIKPSR